MDELVIYTFTITYVLLLTTATITFIEAIRTSDESVRHILNLETAISLIAGYFYSVFVEKLKDKKTTYKEITVLRYIDWSMTTPIMLIVLMMFLSSHIKKVLPLSLLLIVVVLNYTMLYAGYLGEKGQLERWTAWAIGFLAFFAMFGLIYKNFLQIYNLPNYVVYGLFIVVWSLYGVFYMMDEITKNVGMNVLDCIAKCLVGLGLWAYFSKIFVLG
jgi:bacteriorhodopsin